MMPEALVHFSAMVKGEFLSRVCVAGPLPGDAVTRRIAKLQHALPQMLAFRKGWTACEERSASWRMAGRRGC